MTFTKEDLLRWVKEEDVDKFSQILRFLSGEKYNTVRIDAVQILGKLQNSQSLQVLLRAMGDDESSVADQAKAVLMNWYKKSPAFFNQCIKDSKLPTYLCERCLCIIEWKIDRRTLDVFFQLLQQNRCIEKVQQIITGQKSHKYFLDKITDSDPAIRYYGLLAVADVKPTKKLISVFKTTLLDENVQVKALTGDILTKQLEKIRDDQPDFDSKPFNALLEPLIKNLGDEDYDVRANAAKALGELRDESAMPSLIQAMNDPEPKVRFNAIYAVGQMPHLELFPKLAEMYSNEESVEMRRVILFAISKLPSEEAEAFLKKIIKDDPNGLLSQDAKRYLRRRSSSKIGFILQDKYESLT